jgi:acetyl esterase
VEKHIHEYGGISEKIAIGGDSAGGNLTAATTLLARERKGPNFIYQVLICPALNYNFETFSYSQFSKGYFLTTEDTKFFWNTYLQRSENGLNPYASPLQASQLSALPSACIVIAHFDPLRDDGIDYAKRLSEEGVITTIQSYNSIHGFYGYPELDIASEAISFISEQLKIAFASP